MDRRLQQSLRAPLVVQVHEYGLIGHQISPQEPCIETQMGGARLPSARMLKEGVIIVDALEIIPRERIDVDPNVEGVLKSLNRRTVTPSRCRPTRLLPSLTYRVLARRVLFHWLALSGQSEHRVAWFPTRCSGRSRMSRSV